MFICWTIPDDHRNWLTLYSFIPYFLVYYICRFSYIIEMFQPYFLSSYFLYVIADTIYFHVLCYLWNNSIKLILNHTEFSFFLLIISWLIFQLIIVSFYLNLINPNAYMYTDNISLISNIYEHKLAFSLFENITMNWKLVKVQK